MIKGSDDDTDFQTHIGQCTSIDKVLMGEGIIMLRNETYTDFSSRIDGVAFTWDQVLYKEYDSHYELWLEEV